MSLEFLTLFIEIASTLAIFAGMLYSYSLSKKTSKATVFWSLMLLLSVTLVMNSVAEIYEFSGGFAVASSPLSDIGERLEQNTLLASSAIILCIALVLKRSLLVPV